MIERAEKLFSRRGYKWHNNLSGLLILLKFISSKSQNCLTFSFLIFLQKNVISLQFYWSYFFLFSKKQSIFFSFWFKCSLTLFVFKKQQSNFFPFDLNVVKLFFSFYFIREKKFNVLLIKRKNFDCLWKRKKK